MGRGCGRDGAKGLRPSWHEAYKGPSHGRYKGSGKKAPQGPKKAAV